MTFIRMQLSLALFLAVICVVAGELTMEDWQQFLKEKPEYKEWCNNTKTGFQCNLTGKLSYSKDCAALFYRLKPIMEIYHSHLYGFEAVVNVKAIINSTDFCTMKHLAGSSTTSTTAGINSTTFTAHATSQNEGGLAGGTGPHLTKPNATGSPSAPSPKYPTSCPTEADETNRLYLILPLLCLVVVVVALGGIQIQCYTKKAGHHHSAWRSCKSDSGFRLLDLESSTTYAQRGSFN